MTLNVNKVKIQFFFNLFYIVILLFFTVMKESGTTFRSKPYHFRAQNGGFVLMETEWSSFVNPWSKKLEFVIGQHRVLKV